MYGRMSGIVLNVLDACLSPVSADVDSKAG